MATVTASSMSGRGVRTEKPFGVVLVVALGVIHGLANIILGAFILIDRNDPRLLDKAGWEEGGVVAAGIICLVVGAVAIALAMALNNGSEVVRVLYAIVAAINLVTGLHAVVAFEGEQRYAGGFAAVIAAIVLWILVGDRDTNEYFREQHRH